MVPWVVTPYRQAVDAPRPGGWFLKSSRRDERGIGTHDGIVRRSWGLWSARRAATEHASARPGHVLNSCPGELSGLRRIKGGAGRVGKNSQRMALRACNERSRTATPTGRLLLSRE